jgi:fatty-acyl-CoA synthase
MTEVVANDAKFARRAWLRALERTAPIERDSTLTLPVVIERLATRFAAAPALESLEASLCYAGLAARCSQYARWGLAQRLSAGDVVCLVMENCAEYLPVWLGLTRIGVAVALVNTHLTGRALAHCIRIVAPKLLLVSADCAAALTAICRELPDGLPVCSVGTAGLADFATQPLSVAQTPPPTQDTTALYIYTSGTTGLPKAAAVSHYRLMQWSHWFAGLLDTGPEDRMYDCLPLYHSVGGVVATCATLVGGGAVVIRPRFSASDFWRDVTESRCTLFQYIGELCRYLVNAPPHRDETRHTLRIACGNGLRPEIWETFRGRFGIPRILEYYASTEGNFSLYNCEGEPGSIGRIPPFLASRLPVSLVRFDVARGEPVRDASGRCIACEIGESGEAIGLIPEGSGQRAGRFEGYADAAASERKVLRDVFEAGDAWYRTGDLMRRDARGFYYFVDRIGDTYRWKGENVSTAEVLSVLTAVPGVLEGVVYGVSVPGADGRAGMAALVVDPAFDLAEFQSRVATELPGYARPLFLRLLTALAATATFKPLKQDLECSGFDPAQTRDPLLFYDSRQAAYVPLDDALHAQIRAGALRF